MRDLTELQVRLLDMLETIHFFCIAEGLRYYTVGGTTLEGVRHKG